MTATFSKVKLSGSTSGRGIKVAQSATLGTTIHTAHATSLDEIWLWAINDSTSATKLLTVEFGGVTDPDDLITATIPIQGAGPVLVVPGLILTGGLVCSAFAATANLVVLFGFVNRIT